MNTTKSHSQVRRFFRIEHSHVTHVITAALAGAVPSFTIVCSQLFPLYSGIPPMQKQVQKSCYRKAATEKPVVMYVYDYSDA